MAILEITVFRRLKATHILNSKPNARRVQNGQKQNGLSTERPKYRTPLYRNEFSVNQFSKSIQPDRLGLKQPNNHCIASPQQSTWPHLTPYIPKPVDRQLDAAEELGVTEER